jgi:hypothetical protein
LLLHDALASVKVEVTRQEASEGSTTMITLGFAGRAGRRMTVIRREAFSL